MTEKFEAATCPDCGTQTLVEDFLREPCECDPKCTICQRPFVSRDTSVHKVCPECVECVYVILCDISTLVAELEGEQKLLLLRDIEGWTREDLSKIRTFVP